MIAVRFLSIRSPYQRGGLTFDVAKGRTGAGAAVVECDEAAMARMTIGQWRELLTDPAISIDWPGRNPSPAPGTSPPAPPRRGGNRSPPARKKA